MQTRRVLRLFGAPVLILAAGSAIATAGPASPDARPVDAAPTTSLPSHCPGVIATAREVLTSGAGDEKARNEVHARISRAAAESEGCAVELQQVLTSTPCGGTAWAVVASAAFGAPSFEPAWTAALVARANEELRRGDDACMKAVVPGVQHAARVDLSLVRALEDLASYASDENAPKAGQLALGSVGFRARAAGDVTLAERVEVTLARNLRSATPQTRGLALEAAGNAGCASCIPEIEPALSDPEPLIRRSAVAALRHLDKRRSVGSLCARLRQDADVGVREHAAWAIPWGAGHDDLRSSCLEAAAQSDSDETVRKTAARSLGLIASRSPEAAAVIARMAGAPDEDLRVLAALALDERALPDLATQGSNDEGASR